MRGFNSLYHFSVSVRLCKKPLFSVRRNGTAVSVWFYQLFCISGLSVPLAHFNDDRVPVSFTCLGLQTLNRYIIIVDSSMNYPLLTQVCQAY